MTFNNLLNEISKIKNLEKGVAGNNRNKCERFRKKWHRIENEVPWNLIRNKQKINLTLYKPTEGRRQGQRLGGTVKRAGGGSFSFISFY